jgi:hypothetical protein
MKTNKFNIRELRDLPNTKGFKFIGVAYDYTTSPKTTKYMPCEVIIKDGIHCIGDCSITSIVENLKVVREEPINFKWIGWYSYKIHTLEDGKLGLNFEGAL